MIPGVGDSSKGRLIPSSASLEVRKLKPNPKLSKTTFELRRLETH